jgi:spoIIIJ-associated protein
MPDFEWTVDSLGPRIEAFLNPVLDAADFDLGYDLYEVNRSDDAIGPEVAVDFNGGDARLLLRRRGSLLLALEHLTLEALRIPHQDRFRLIFDVEDYRILRIEELRQSAKVAAERVKRTGRRFAFRPMTSRERRILHVALRDEDAVKTLSEGVPPYRYTVVSLRQQGKS